jgi:hypothetical protein
MIVDVDGIKMEALFRIVLKGFERFYIKRGNTILAKGKNGDICEIGHRRKNKEKWQIVELAQFYRCPKPWDETMCLRSIIRIEFNPLTKKYIVRFKKKQIFRGIATGIAGPGENYKFPELIYYTLVKERKEENDKRRTS